MIARALVALAAMASGTAAAAQPVPCLTSADAEAITLVALPEIIRDAGRVCAALPSSSLLRRADGKFIAKYDAEADRAWPTARGAIAKLSDPAVELLLMSNYSRAMLTSVFAPQITGGIEPDDCPTVDRMVTLLEPLPPRNTAALVVTTIQYMRAKKVKGVPPLPLCAAATSK